MLYDVMVTRIEYGSRVIQVDAETEEEAKIKAIDEAGDYSFSCHDADYDVDWVKELP